MSRQHGYLRRGACVIVLFSLACSSAGAPEPAVELEPVEASVSPPSAAETITAGEMQAHISYLASDELAGRDTPSPGLEAAAVYISEAFQSAGLEPAGDPGSFLQRWDYVKSSLRVEATTVAYGDGDGGVVLNYAEDFFIIPGEAPEVTGEVLFGGSITTLLSGSVPETAGQILLVTMPPTMGTLPLGAARVAGEAGASALILVMDPRVPPEVIGMIQGQVSGSGLPLQAVPTLGVTWDVASAMLSSAGVDLTEIAGDAGEGAASALISGLSVTVTAPMDTKASTPPNVIGLIRGTDPVLADEYVILSAHFDHVGIGEADASGDSIFNGADDNASGTSVLLEVAQAFRAMNEAPARSVVFLAVSGEEKGLLGAAHFADHPTVPGDGIVANINLDMIGRNAPDTVIAVGMEHTSLGGTAVHITEHHPELGLTVVPDPNPEEQAFFRSDHLVFVKQDIPSIFLTTWLHDDYHKPSDEVGAIDSDKAARIARLVFLLAWHVAEDSEAPTWNEGALEQVHEILKTSPL